MYNLKFANNKTTIKTATLVVQSGITVVSYQSQDSVLAQDEPRELEEEGEEEEEAARQVGPAASSSC